MPVLTEKWITEPLSIVQELFEKCGGTIADQSTVDSVWGVKQFFEERLKDDSNLTSIPLLNTTPPDHLPGGCLVRYRCMVQDQFDPEFYLKVYHTHSTEHSEQTASQSVNASCGMYMDVMQHLPGTVVDFDHPANITGDRQTLYCIPIPAETQWVKECYKANSSNQTSLCVDSMDTADRSVDAKRRFSEDGEDGMEEDVMGGSGDGEESSQVNKKKKEDSDSDVTMTSSAAAVGNHHDMNFPLPNEKGSPCLVKVYEDFDSYKVTSMVEFIGVLSVDPVLAQFEPTGQTDSGVGDNFDPFSAESAAERSVHSPPPSLIPRLHAISARILTLSNPPLPGQLSVPMEKSVFTQLAGNSKTCRQLILDLLTETLLGDRLAAEFTLLHLLSSVYGRTEIIALGKFALNLSNCPQVSDPNSSLVFSLNSVLQNILSKCFLLPMSLSNMNNWRFSPKKDYTSNRLLSGLLQLTDGTNLLVDETVLTAGQLSEVGVKNLTALGNVIQWQKVHYDFQYHTAEFTCNLPVMIVSEGKSMLQVDCHVPLSPTQSCDPERVKALLSQLQDTELNDIRRYLSLHCHMNYQLTNQVQKAVEEDFVTLRRNDPKMNAEVFHQLLTVARLLCLSYGCFELNLEMWTQAKELERQRRLRIN